MLNFLLKNLNSFIQGLGFSTDDRAILFSSKNHSTYLKHHRAEVINERIKGISLFFALMIVLWVAVDFFLLPEKLATEILYPRFFAAFLFIMLAISITDDNSGDYARFRLAVMMLIPSGFYIVIKLILSNQQLEGMGGVLVGIYDLLPFLIVAGLSLFPLTIIETLAIGSLCLSSIFLGIISFYDNISAGYFSAGWMLILILGADIFSAMVQLKYISTLLGHMSTDPLTGALSRQAGQQMVEIHFELSVEKQLPFALAFIDLDKFKSINDTYGHDQGDEMLKQAVSILKAKLRRGDQIIRWGGEEFLLILLDANTEGIKVVIDRIMEGWLGSRPDGTKLTASIGISERIHDSIDGWDEQINLADKRMYRAKQSGRAQAIISG